MECGAAVASALVIKKRILIHAFVNFHSAMEACMLMIGRRILTEKHSTTSNMLMLIRSAANILNIPAMLMGNLAVAPALTVGVSGRIGADGIGTVLMSFCRIRAAGKRAVLMLLSICAAHNGAVPVLLGIRAAGNGTVDMTCTLDGAAFIGAIAMGSGIIATFHITVGMVFGISALGIAAASHLCALYCLRHHRGGVLVHIGLTLGDKLCCLEEALHFMGIQLV